MTRDEHLKWAKARALEYWEEGDYIEAVTSLMSDMQKHEELRDHAGLGIGVMWIMAPDLHHDRDFVYRFIVGFR